MPSLFRKSVIGEYLAMSLMLVAGYGIVAWTLAAWRSPAGLCFVITGIWIVCRAIGVSACRWFAPLVTLALASLVFAYWRSELEAPHALLSIVSAPAFILMLGIVLAADLFELVSTMPLRLPNFLRRLPLHRVALLGIAAVFLIYMILIPAVMWFVGILNPPKSGEVLVELSLSELIRIRSVEAICALWFVALGATVGSFLNVVVYRLPRGESVIFRRSRCPQCGTQIKGRDNLPILGWLLLGGKCRACQSKISSRYPTVEFITASIFLLFYFVELISGGENIPVRQPNFNRGVIWIILYTKWDILGIYLFHCSVMSMLLTVALIDYDRQRIGVRAKALFGLAMLLLPLMFPHFFPVPVINQPASWGAPSITEALTRVATGGVVGVLLGSLVFFGIRRKNEPVANVGQVVSFLGLTGLAVGWQAAIAVTLIAFAMQLALSVFKSYRRWNPPLTVVLMVAFVIHHVAWRWLAENAAAWWPGSNTGAPGWIVIAIALLILGLANRFCYGLASETDEDSLTIDEPEEMAKSADGLTS